jgi:hypothetical protein
MWVVVFLGEIQKLRRAHSDLQGIGYGRFKATLKFAITAAVGLFFHQCPIFDSFTVTVNLFSVELSCSMKCTWRTTSFM